MAKFQRFSALIECSTGVTPTVASVKRYITMLAKMGYTELYLGLTDGYKMEKQPYFNYKRGGYTTEDLNELDACAKAAGIELIANIQTLGHLDFLARHESYRDMMDTANILLVGDERVYALVDQMFGAISKGLSSRRIHIGFDECWGLGTGNYLKRFGPADKKELLLRHLKRVLTIAQKYGYTCEIWHDMLVEKDNTVVTAADVRAALPEDVIVWYWEYWEKDEPTLRVKVDDVKTYAAQIGFAGTAFKCGSMAPLNTFSLARLLPQMKIASEKGIASYMVTLWSDNGAWVNNYAVLPALYAAAEYNRGAWDGVGELDKERFREITGGDYDQLMMLDRLDDPLDVRPVDGHGNRSFWITLCDLFNGGWDLLLDPREPEAYAALSETFSSFAAGEPDGAYAHLYRSSALFARFLGLKCRLGVDIRAAYAAGDKQALADCLVRVRELKQALADYIPVYNAAWLHDSMPFGLEIDQIFLGGQLVRLDYVASRMEAHLATGERIGELDAPTVLPDLAPGVTADGFWNSDWKTIVSNCGF